MFRTTKVGLVLMVIACLADGVRAGPPPAVKGEEYVQVVVGQFGRTVNDDKKPLYYFLDYKREKERNYESQGFELNIEWTQKTAKGDVKVTGAQLNQLWGAPKEETKAWIRRETKTGKVLEVFHPDATVGWEK